MKASFKSLLAAFLLTGGFALSSAPAQAALITFEGLADLEVVTNQFAAQNVTFSNATGAIAFPFGSLNELDFPPTSGTTVVTNEVDTDFDTFPDDVGPIEIFFSSFPVDSVSAYFVYADYNFTGDPLTVHAFGVIDPINPISTLTLFENLGSPTLLSFSGIGAISSLSIFGGFGSFFTIDNLNVGGPVTNGATIVPEPSTFVLMGLGIAGLLSRSRFKKQIIS